MAMPSANNTVMVPSNQLDELIGEMKKLNQTVTDLSKKLNDLDLSGSGVKASLNSSLALTPIADKTASGQPSRLWGYVNWNKTHDILITYEWQKASNYINYCGIKERQTECNGPNSFFSVTVNCEQRFPQGGLYVNVSNPLVAAEILYIQEIHFTARELQNNKSGSLVSHFLEGVKNHAHTRSSFEELYGLKWVDRRFGGFTLNQQTFSNIAVTMHS